MVAKGVVAQYRLKPMLAIMVCCTTNAITNNALVIMLLPDPATSGHDVSDDVVRVMR